MTRKPPAKSAGPARPTPPRSAPAVRPRVVVIHRVTYVPVKGDPTSVESGTGRFLGSDEQPYHRPKFLVGPAWKPVDLGWLAGEEPGVVCVSQVVLVNTEGTALQRVPTPEEREATARCVVEVGVARPVGGGDMWEPEGGELEDVQPDYEVHPGEGFTFRPVDAARVRVRCRHRDHPARCDLLVVPG